MSGDDFCTCARCQVLARLVRAIIHGYLRWGKIEISFEDLTDLLQSLPFLEIESRDKRSVPLPFLATVGI